MTEDKRRLIKHSITQFLVFTTDGRAGIEVRYEYGTLWLTQKLMSELFAVDVQTVREHLKNIYVQQELAPDSVVRRFRTTASDGKQSQTQHYNLDAIIAVGYRVNSVRATQFRQWSTRILRGFTLRGYIIDRERMENGEVLGVDYSEHLLQKVPEIRLSERRFHQKVTDIYATAVDYNKDAVLAKQFFAPVQNKLHCAVHGNTATELIRERADANRPQMCLTSWKAGPEGIVVRGDVSVGNNYLTKMEMEDLARLADAFLDLAESRAQRGIATTTEDWAMCLDQALTLDSRKLLENAGRIAKKDADNFAIDEFDKFRVIQDWQFQSDFDQFIEVVSNELEGPSSE